MKATLSPYLIRKITGADHHDPFGILGMHELDRDSGSGIVVRAFQPDAEEILIVPHGKPQQKLPMDMIHRDGLFERVFEKRHQFFDYMLEVHYSDGTVEHRHDPYSFPPVLTDYDMHLFAEGAHHRIYDKLGAHKTVLKDVEGFLFAVWAPNARRVSLVGDFNCWDGRRHCMRSRGSSGIWELFVPGISDGTLYKYEIKSQSGLIHFKADPYGFFAEKPPRTASVTWTCDDFSWSDEQWITRRDSSDKLAGPLSIYEVHFGSWMRIAEEENRSMTYREAASHLVDYVSTMGYTHIEFLPLAAHPFDPSWGYQVTGYYSPTARYGTPQELMYLINECHRHDIGVILDWVPAHFPSDSDGLAWYDGTCLYEHSDPKEGTHPDWGTLVFNYGRNEVSNFLIANALFWLETYHIDGLRVDAVASMLYRDYSRKEGEWVTNRYGGRENLEAIDFLKRLNKTVYSYNPGVLMIAEESTSWPSVSRPTYLGGLGFAMKWNMGWMHDILEYISKDPVHRKFHHNMLTFALLYTFYENFILPFSHDEVVHGKGSLMGKMPGDDWQKFANMRLLLGYMFGHPGKKHLFMGIDIGQWAEWDHNSSVEWHLLSYDQHKKLQEYVRTLNKLYRSETALYERDFECEGFEWIDFNDSDNSVISFMRKGFDPDNILVFVYNLTPIPREQYRIGVPCSGFFREVSNSDADTYGGSNMGNAGGVQAEHISWHGRACSITITVPPLSCLVFKPEQV